MKGMKKAVGGVVLLLLAIPVAVLAWLTTGPSALDAESWEPAAAPAMVGVLAPDDKLQQVQLLGHDQVKGPEDVAFDAQGRVYSGLEDGRIVRIEDDKASNKVVTLANTGGRPLGMAFDAAGNLIICDSGKGLLKLTPDGQLSTLVTAVDGVRLNFADDLDIARDGKIYFSDASTKYGQSEYMINLFEGRPYGRLYVYDPATGQTKLLLKDLYFANGVALSKAEDAVYVAETFRYRLRRLWLSGPKAGQVDIVADNLPGMPDNINSDRNGILWVALPSPRRAIADISAKHGWMRQLMFKLPPRYWPKPERYGLVVAVDEEGKLLRSLHDPSGKTLRMVTSVLPHDGHLYFGSLEVKGVGKL